MATSRSLQAALAALNYVVKNNEGMVCSIGKISRYKKRNNNISGFKHFFITSYAVGIHLKNTKGKNEHITYIIVYLVRKNQKWIITEEDAFIETED